MAMTTEERLSRLEGVYEHLATKADLADLAGATKADIAALAGATKADIANLRTELLIEIARMEARLTRWTVGTIIVGLGVVVAVLKLTG